MNRDDKINFILNKNDDDDNIVNKLSLDTNDSDNEDIKIVQNEDGLEKIDLESQHEEEDIEQEEDLEKKSKKISLNDFELLKVLGRGSFGKVMLVKKSNAKIYAMKI